MNHLSAYEVYYINFRESGGYILGIMKGNDYKVKHIVQFPNYAKDPRNTYKLPNLFQLIKSRSCRHKTFELIKFLWKGFNIKTGRFEVRIIGEWHTHICKDLLPSGQDIKSMQEKANARGKMWILGIGSRDPKTRKTLFNFYDYKPTKIILKLKKEKSKTL